MSKNLILLFAFTAAAITSCQKRDIQVNDSMPQAVVDAKNWFENNFKKTKEWETLLRKESGADKLNWANLKYSKKDRLEVFEVPIKGKASSITIPTINSTTQDQENLTTVLNNSSKSLLIVNRNGDYFVLQKEYIPKIGLFNNNTPNSRSENVIPDIKNFAGKTIYLSSTGDVILYNEIANNHVHASYKKSGIYNVNSQQVNRQESINSSSCIEVTIIRYSWTCFPVYIVNGNSTQVETVCVLFSDDDIETYLYCQTNGCNEVQCTEYGVMSGYIPPPSDPENPPVNPATLENCQDYAENNLFPSFTDNLLWNSEMMTVDVVDIDATTKSKTFKWKVASAGGGYYIWHRAKGIIKYRNGRWEWDSLEHDRFQMGGVPIGGAIALANLVTTPSFVAGTQNVLSARINLNFDITWQLAPFVCGSHTITLQPASANYDCWSPYVDANP